MNQASQKEAKQKRICYRCGGGAHLCQRIDGTGSPRAINWCFVCKAPAFGGASFERVDEPRLSSLPMIGFEL